MEKQDGPRFGKIFPEIWRGENVAARSSFPRYANKTDLMWRRRHFE